MRKLSPSVNLHRYTTAGAGSTSGMCVAKKKDEQDDKTIATSIGAGIAVLVLGCLLCYVVVGLYKLNPVYP
jgi:hypothetical protein